jgi:PiT family inorganic phosphate transporter
MRSTIFALTSRYHSGRGEQPILHTNGGTLALTRTTNLEAKVDQEVNCTAYYKENFWRINIEKAVTLSHYLSAGAVSFARGLNDTPKIVALCLAAKALNLTLSHLEQMPSD